MENQQTKTLSLAHIVIGLFLLQLFFVQSLWGHSSDAGQVLGRYSTRYTIILLLSLGIQFGWVVVFFSRKRIERWIQAIPSRFVAAGLVLLAATVVPVLLQPIEHHVRYYYIVTIWSIMTLIIYCLPDKPIDMRWINRGLIALFLLILIPGTISSLTRRQFSPDDAQWADMATTFFVEGGVYMRTWRQEPILISPGFGWFNVAYGWVLENIAFHPFTGMLWNLLGDGLSVIGIGLLTNKLYGRRIAWTAVVITVFQTRLWESPHYRPDYWVLVTSTFALWLMVSGLKAQGRWRYLYHFLAGLLITLSMQVHSITLVFTISISLFYLIHTLRECYQQRDWKPLLPSIAFGIGAGIGTAIFIIFNVLPVGGFEIFLEQLFLNAPARERPFLQYIIRIESWFRVLTIGGLIYLIWRRNQTDRFFLSIFTLCFIFMSVVDTQGYSLSYYGLYIVPIAVLFADGLRAVNLNVGFNRRSVWIILALITMTLSWMLLVRTLWGDVTFFLQTGQLKKHEIIQLTDPLLPYVTSEDVIAASHELIWIFHGEENNLVAFQAEAPRTSRYEWDEPIELWEQVEPTAVIEIERRIPIPPGLLAYMEQEGFEVCLQYEELGRQVTLYRETCSSAANVQSES